ncbi:MAG: STAS domain-containing protein [Actinomycetota bacterium]|jgi:anti-sigma B factor antagonist|nr:STAS domain-containing protein [Actinomycetota bacterium]
MNESNFDIQEHAGVILVSPRKDFDTGTVDEFQHRTDGLLGRGFRYFVINLEGVNFVDSAGLGALVRLYKRVRIGEGDVCLAHLSSGVMRILELTRLSRVFDVYPDAQEATAYMKQQQD